jgi:hypothetical protein
MENADLPAVVFRHRHRQRRRRQMVLMVAFPMLLLMLAGVCVPVLVPLIMRGRAAAADRALRRLPYPAMPGADAEARLIRWSREGFSFVKTPALRVGSMQAEMVLTATASALEGDRTGPIDTVDIELVTRSGATLPLSSFLKTPLVLKTAGGDLAVFSTEFEVSQLSKFKEADETSVMFFTLPTAAFLAWTAEAEPRGQIGEIEFVVPGSSREILIALAASLRPAGKR